MTPRPLPEPSTVLGTDSHTRACRSLPRTVVGSLVALIAVAVVLGTFGAFGHRAEAQAGAEAPVATTSAPASAADVARAELTPGKAIVLGAVEGVTEFLPISSSGHLLVVQDLLGVGATDATKDAADAYAIVIQGGAIAAVLLIYWSRVVQVLRGLVGRDPEGRRLLIALAIGFLPSALVGVVLEKKIKGALFAPWPIVLAWIVGGVAILVLSRNGWLRPDRVGSPLSSITYRHAAIIGAAQCLALWPGTSRSLATIVAAASVGLALSAAVEYSFLLGLVTLSAATALDAVKDGRHIVENYGAVNPAIGFACAAISGFVAVKWMIGYLQRRSFAVFGWYRLGIAAVTVALLLTNVL